MKRVALIAGLCLATGALVAPLASAANGERGKSEIARECAKLKKADRAAFRATYGKHAMRKCIRGNGPDASKVTPREFRNAAQECRAERAEDREAFQEAYGTNRNKRNALGKCVSTKVRDRGNGDGGENGGEEPAPEAA